MWRIVRFIFRVQGMTKAINMVRIAGTQQFLTTIITTTLSKDTFTMFMALIAMITESSQVDRDQFVRSGELQKK